MRYVFQIGRGQRHEHHDLPDDEAAIREARRTAALHGQPVWIFREDDPARATEVAMIRPPQAPPGRVH